MVPAGRGAGHDVGVRSRTHRLIAHPAGRPRARKRTVPLSRHAEVAERERCPARALRDATPAVTGHRHAGRIFSGHDRAWSSCLGETVMTLKRSLRIAAVFTARAAGVAAVAYSGLVARRWRRYGHPQTAGAAERDPVLDRFMPSYDVVERHHIAVRAPAGLTLAVAKSTPLLLIPAVRAIFRAREIILGAVPGEQRPRGLLEETLALGWGILDDIPDREVVVGAVTRPWEANVTFLSLAPEAF